MNYGHWIPDFILEGNCEVPFGFIYEITNLCNNRKYIGKKQCLCVRKQAPLKGKTRKRRKTVETDWKEYTSSSTQLNIDIITLGKENFAFKILKWCGSKWELSYNESKLQFEK